MYVVREGRKEKGGGRGGPGIVMPWQVMKHSLAKVGAGIGQAAVPGIQWIT
jgi:hypothetical protein